MHLQGSGVCKYMVKYMQQAQRKGGGPREGGLLIVLDEGVEVLISCL